MTERLDYRAIGSRVRELRLQHKMTQEYLAEMVDISPSFIGHIERGEKKPSLETMSRLTMVLHQWIISYWNKEQMQPAIMHALRRSEEYT